MLRAPSGAYVQGQSSGKSDHINMLIKHNPGYRNSGTRILLASRSIACYRHLCQEAMHELLVGNVRGAMPKKHQNLVFHLLPASNSLVGMIGMSSVVSNRTKPGFAAMTPSCRGTIMGTV